MELRMTQISSIICHSSDEYELVRSKLDLDHAASFVRCHRTVGTHLLWSPYPLALDYGGTVTQSTEEQKGTPTLRSHQCWLLGPLDLCGTPKT